MHFSDMSDNESGHDENGNGYGDDNDIDNNDDILIDYDNDRKSSEKSDNGDEDDDVNDDINSMASSTTITEVTSKSKIHKRKTKPIPRKRAKKHKPCKIMQKLKRIYFKRYDETRIPKIIVDQVEFDEPKLFELCHAAYIGVFSERCVYPPQRTAFDIMFYPKGDVSITKTNAKQFADIIVPALETVVGKVRPAIIDFLFIWFAGMSKQELSNIATKFVVYYTTLPPSVIKKHKACGFTKPDGIANLSSRLGTCVHDWQEYILCLIKTFLDYAPVIPNITNILLNIIVRCIRIT